MKKINIVKINDNAEKKNFLVEKIINKKYINLKQKNY